MQINIYTKLTFVMKLFKYLYVYFKCFKMSYIKCFKFTFFKYKYFFLNIYSPFCKNFKTGLINWTYNFFTGFLIFVLLEGKRFKGFLNKNYVFFKMDTSHFKNLNFSKNFFLKKKKK